MYQATLTGPGTSTPELTQVMATFAGTNTSTLYGFAYDPTGNISETTTLTSAGTASEARTINNLNQVTTNVVTPAVGSPTTYHFTYNLDGTLATKYTGSGATLNQLNFTWDADGDQRLLSVSQTLDVTTKTLVAFTYDSIGRMLTRTPYTDGEAGTATRFEWDNFDCVREFTPDGVFRYYIPQGELLTFDYTPSGDSTSTYCVHSDALGSVRAITDDTGAVVAHYEYDAFGNLLPSSSDLSPSFPYRYVGSLGVRWDETLGMYYCRQRWYDATLQRWISRDPLGSINRYVCCGNQPTAYVDPMGLLPAFPYHPQAPLLQPSIDIVKIIDSKLGSSMQSEVNLGIMSASPLSGDHMGYTSPAGITIDAVKIAGLYQSASGPRNNCPTKGQQIVIAGTLVHEQTHWTSGLYGFMNATLNIIYPSQTMLFLREAESVEAEISFLQKALAANLNLNPADIALVSRRLTDARQTWHNLLYQGHY